MGIKKGKAQRLHKCCREIRIQAGSMYVGGTYFGFNTLTSENESWLCIKIKKDINDNIMQRVYEAI